MNVSAEMLRIAEQVRGFIPRPANMPVEVLGFPLIEGPDGTRWCPTNLCIKAGHLVRGDCTAFWNWWDGLRPQQYADAMNLIWPEAGTERTQVEK